MNLTVAWKEYREQRMVWIPMTVLAALCLVGLFQFANGAGGFGASDFLPLLLLGTLALVGTHGLVCGAMLLADEEESGTLSFLDTLPAGRRAMWRAKFLAGLVLTISQAVLVGAGLMALDVQVELHKEVGWLWILPAIAVEAFAWGMAASVLCRRVLSAAGLGAVVLTFIWAASMPTGWEPTPTFLLVRGGLAILAAAYSRRVFTRLDRQRRITRKVSVRNLAGWALGHPSLRSLLWLFWRQGRGTIAVLGVMGLLSGWTLPWAGVLLWPFFTLCIGMVCGLAVFTSETAPGFQRFLGEQRFPPTRIWAMKIVCWLCVALFVSILVLLGGAFHVVLAGPTGINGRDMHRPFLTRILGDQSEVLRQASLIPFAFLWVLHGFAIGQLFSLTCRKSVVAGFLTILVSVSLALVWLPSVLSGGLHAWQILGVPLILLIASRLLWWAWSSQRMASLQPISVMVTCSFAVGMWLAGNLTYRILEVPAEPEPFDVKAFEDSHPLPQDNKAASKLTEMLRVLKDKERQVGADLAFANEADATHPVIDPVNPSNNPVIHSKKPGNLPNQPGGFGRMPQPAGPNTGAGILQPNQPAGPGAPLPQTIDYDLLLDRYLGEEQDVPDLTRKNGWLDRLFEPSEGKIVEKTKEEPSNTAHWPALLHEVRDMPLAVLTDPQTVNQLTVIQLSKGPWSDLQWTSKVVLARARQLQEREGDDDAALELLLDNLSLSRHLRNRNTPMGWMVGLQIERSTLLRLMSSWTLNLLNRAGSKREKLLRRALEALTRHEDALPAALDSLKVDYLRVRNDLFDPTLVSNLFKGKRPLKRITDDLRLLAWLPWERGRIERMQNEVFAGWIRAMEMSYPAFHDSMQTSGPGSRGWLYVWVPLVDGPSGNRTRNRLNNLTRWSWLVDVLYPWPAKLCYIVPGGQCHVRATRLQLALLLYLMENKESAPTLQALVPEYFKEVPTDPFSGKPFLYAVAEGGEKFQPGHSLNLRDDNGVLVDFRELHPDEGRVWSVGPDCIDHGGLSQGLYHDLSDELIWRDDKKLDLVFLVPRRHVRPSFPWFLPLW